LSAAPVTAGRGGGVTPHGDNPDVGAGFFAIDIAEAALTYVGDPADHLVIETWHAGRGHARRRRHDPTEEPA
jgi:hypothetical protein